MALGRARSSVSFCGVLAQRLHSRYTRTVQRDLRTTTFSGRKRRSDRGHSLLEPYKAALLERWNAGCHSAARCFGTSNSAATPAATPSWRPMPVACARRKAWRPGNDGQPRGCQSWLSPYTSP
jgi:hypothetical protein